MNTKSERGVRNLLKRNRPIAEIAEDTGLSFDEIKNLAH